MESFELMLEMGGYGRFVWPAFALTLAVLAVLLLVSLRSLRARESALEALQTGPRRGRGEAVRET